MTMTHICELSPSGEPAESARELLDRHGLPEDVIDGALALHAQELAAVQRREAAVWGVDTAAGKHILGAADLIDPTRGALPAAVPVPPPADQTALRDRIAAALYRHEWPGKQVWVQALAMDREVFEAMADAVLAVLPEQTDRATLPLTAVERQFLTFALDLASDEMASRGDEFGDEDEAALETLRRVAAEEQPAKPARCPHGCDTSICPCLACEAAEEQPAETHGTTTDKAAALGLTDTDYRARSHAAAVATIRAAIPGMYAHVGFRLEDVLNEADEVQPPETQAHEPTHTWTVESPRRDNWASWGTTYDDRDWALESYEHSTKNAPARPFRLVRATSTYTIEAEHTPPTARPAVGEQPETQEAPNPRTVCSCGHTRGEHVTVSGRLLCDACDPDGTDNLVCKEFEAL